jgi:hypothetical protein
MVLVKGLLLLLLLLVLLLASVVKVLPLTTT